MIEESERIRCRCGRFACNARPVVRHYPAGSEWYAGEPYLYDVVNDCTACGDEAPTARGWWQSWDAWFTD